MAFGGISCVYRLKRHDLSQYMDGIGHLDSVEPGMSFNAAIGLAYAISYALSMNVQFQYGYNMSTEYDFTNGCGVLIGVLQHSVRHHRDWLAHFAENDAVVLRGYRIDVE